MLSKQFETEVAQGPEKIFAYFKYEAAKVFVPESGSGTQRKIANWVAILPNRLAGVRESSSVKASASAWRASAAAAATAQSTSSGPSSKEGQQ